MITDLDPVKRDGPLNEFYRLLVEEYRDRFANDPEYAYSAARISPEDLARKMTLALDCGTASKEGGAIKAVCKRLGIKHTYKAIRQYLGHPG